MVQPLNLDGGDRGAEVLALDAVDAGFRDRVLVVTEGWRAMSAVDCEHAPIDMAAVGVVDSIDLANEVSQ
jgi:microcompartment protein CcmK/EutM